jgi:uncharacterized protein (TIGR02145 family)
MKKIVTFFLMVLISASIFAQAPNKMSYQTVIRNNSNSLVANQIIGIRISILQNSTNGTSIYVESQNPTTNANGLASIEIGSGTILSGNFSAINWAEGPYFIKTETDPTGGTNYTITVVNQLLSVPYSLFSGNGIIGVSATGDSLQLGNGTSIIIPGISAANESAGQTGVVNHSCGAENVHNPTTLYSSVTDQEGNLYKTVVIGNQEWMAENLKTSIYRNGEPIENVSENTSWAALYTGGWCHYNNDSQYECPYGKLYNWYAVADSRNLCPTGWHVPVSSDWLILSDYLGGASVAGGKLKNTENFYWSSPNLNATNEYGFSGIPGGNRIAIGNFTNLSFSGDFWSGTEDGNDGALFYNLNNNGSLLITYGGLKKDGFAVRCIKD